MFFPPFSAPCLLRPFGRWLLPWAGPHSICAKAKVYKKCGFYARCIRKYWFPLKKHSERRMPRQQEALLPGVMAEPHPIISMANILKKSARRTAPGQKVAKRVARRADRPGVMEFQRGRPPCDGPQGGGCPMGLPNGLHGAAREAVWGRRRGRLAGRNGGRG